MPWRKKNVTCHTDQHGPGRDQQLVEKRVAQRLAHKVRPPPVVGLAPGCRFLAQWTIPLTLTSHGRDTTGAPEPSFN
jgi:hypothetical protein